MVISLTGGPTRGWKAKNMPRLALDMSRGITPLYSSVMKLCGMSGSDSTKYSGGAHRKHVESTWHGRPVLSDDSPFVWLV